MQLVEPINQMSETDTLVPALSVFLLGICYEFNREPGEITRFATHSRRDLHRGTLTLAHG